MGGNDYRIGSSNMGWRDAHRVTEFLEVYVSHIVLRSVLRAILSAIGSRAVTIDRVPRGLPSATSGVTCLTFSFNIRTSICLRYFSMLQPTKEVFHGG